MKMTGALKDLTVNRDGTQNVTVTVNTDFARQYDALKGQQITVEITKASKKRSLTANSFCWALCRLIGQSMTPPLADIEVYRQAIKAVGVWWEKPVNKFKIDEYRKQWESGGDGWLFEVIDDYSPSEKMCHLYFGSSTYTADAMAKLLDWLKDQCDQMGLVIPLSKKEEQELLERWGKI